MDIQGNKKFVQVRLLSVFLSTFIIRPQIAYNYLVEKNALVTILEVIYDNIQYFKYQYDRKLFIMGLCSLWKEQFENEKNSDMILKVFQTMLYMMIVQEFDEQKKNFKTQIQTAYEQNDLNVYESIKQKINPNSIPEEDYDDMENEDDDEEEEIFKSMLSASDPVLHTVKQLESQVKTEDEYLIFSNIFYGLKEMNFQRLQWFCTQIDDDAKAA